MRRTTWAIAVVLLAGCGGGQTPASAPTTPATPVTPTPSPSATTSTAPPAPTPTPTRTTKPTATPTPAPTSWSLPAWLRDGVVSRLPTTRRVVALTFDAGAGAQGAASILATLAREQVPATFFLTGRFVAQFPATVSAISRAGHLVGDHTVTHPHLPQLSDSRVRGEVTDAAAAIRSATGRSPRPWFRFPYGDYDSRTLGIVHDLGFGGIGWTVDTLGWEGKSAGTAQDVVRRVQRALQPGAIVLMHVGANPEDGTTYDADALPAVIAAARSAGYSFVTVAG